MDISQTYRLGVFLGLSGTLVAGLPEVSMVFHLSRWGISTESKQISRNHPSWDFIDPT
jgi:hypothetical protein